MYVSPWYELVVLWCLGALDQRHIDTPFCTYGPVDPIGRTPTPTSTVEEMQAWNELIIRSQTQGENTPGQTQGTDPTRSPLGGVRGVHEPQILGCNVTKFCTKIDFVKQIYF